MIKGALLSEDNKYRYQLSRIWNKDKNLLLFIMNNPSKADEDIDDPTIRKIINYAKLWGYGGILVGNLYAYRSSCPKVLKNINDPIGPDNIKNIKILITLADKVIYAWGFNQKEPKWLCELVDIPYCIDISKKGNPKHPLYLKNDLQPKLFLR